MDMDEYRLPAKVNFEQRRASPSQYVCASLIWLGSLVIIVSFAWAATSRNVILSTGSACSLKCQDGMIALPDARCPKMCISQELDQAVIKCQRPSSPQVMISPAVALQGGHGGHGPRRHPNHFANSRRKACCVFGPSGYDGDPTQRKCLLPSKGGLLRDPSQVARACRSNAGTLSADCTETCRKRAAGTPHADDMVNVDELVGRLKAQEDAKGRGAPIKEPIKDEAPRQRFWLPLIGQISGVAAVGRGRFRPFSRPAAVGTATSRRLAAYADSRSLMQLLATPTLLPVFLPLILIVASLWFAILHHGAHIAMWSTASVFVAGLCYGCYLTQNWVMVVIAAVYMIILGRHYKQINLGCSCLQEGLTALSESRFSLIVIIATSLLQLIYTGLLVGTFAFFSQILTVSDTCDLVPLSGTCANVFVALFLLTSSFFTMVIMFSISYAIACWYFHREDENAPATPMLSGLSMALTTPNGTGVCTQAGAVMTFVEYIASKQKKPCSACDPLFCFLMALYSCFRQTLESLCSFAVVAVAMHGGPFVATSKKAMQSIGPERSGKFLLIDANLTWLLRLQAHTLSTILGMFALAVIDADEDLGIFAAIGSGVRRAGDLDDKGAQWMVIAVIFTFFTVLRRPLMTLSIVLCSYIFFGEYVKEYTTFNAVMASLIIGCVGSIVFHQFAEAAKASLDALLYCFSLDEASGFKAPSSPQREMIEALMRKTEAMQALSDFHPSAPPGPQVAPQAAQALSSV